MSARTGRLLAAMVRPLGVMRLRRGERVSEWDYPAGFMTSLNGRLDAIVAEDEDSSEVAS